MGARTVDFFSKSGFWKASWSKLNTCEIATLLQQVALSADDCSLRAVLLDSRKKGIIWSKNTPDMCEIAVPIRLNWFKDAEGADALCAAIARMGGTL